MEGETNGTSKTTTAPAATEERPIPPEEIETARRPGVVQYMLEQQKKGGS